MQQRESNIFSMDSSDFQLRELIKQSGNAHYNNQYQKDIQFRMKESENQRNMLTTETDLQFENQLPSNYFPDMSQGQMNDQAYSPYLDLQAKYNQTSSIIEQMRKDLVSQKQIIEFLKKEKESFDQERQKFQRMIKDLKMQLAMSSKSKQLAEIDKRYFESISELIQAQEKLKFIQEIDESFNDLQRKESDRNFMKTIDQNATDFIIGEQARQMEECYQTQILRLTQEKEKLNCDKTEEINKLNQQIISYQQQMRLLDQSHQKQLQGLQKQITAYKLNEANLKRQINALIQEKYKLQNQYKQTQKKELHKSVSSKSGDELQKKLDGLREEKRLLNNKTMDLEQRIITLQRQLNVSNEDKLRQQKMITSLEETIKKQIKKYEKLKQEHDKLLSDRIKDSIESDKVTKKYQEQIERLTTLNNLNIKSKPNLPIGNSESNSQKEKTLTNDSILDLKKRIQDLQRQRDSLLIYQSKVAQLKSTIDDLTFQNQQLKLLQIQVVKLRSAHSDIPVASDKILHQNELKKQSSEKVSEKLRNQNHSFRNENNILKIRLKEKDEELTKYKNQLTLSKYTNDKKEEQFRAIIQKLKIERVNNATEIKKLKEQIANIKQEMTKSNSINLLLPKLVSCFQGMSMSQRADIKNRLTYVLS